LNGPLGQRFIFSGRSLLTKIIKQFILFSFSVQGGSSVRTYLDCHWITTQILHSHSLAIPPDTDLIVGYMFQVKIERKKEKSDIKVLSFLLSLTHTRTHFCHNILKVRKLIFRNISI